MRIGIVHILFLCSFSVLISCEEDDEDYEKNKKKVVGRLTKINTVLLDGYDLVTKQIEPKLQKFLSYRNVITLYYPMPKDVTEARFIFQSESVQLNNFGSCKIEDLVINLKRSSVPALNPNGYEFPKRYISPNNRDEAIHTIELKSDGTNLTFYIKHPKPGNWFALAYIKWTDPKFDQVEQAGLAPDCYTVLYTDLQVKMKKNITMIDCYNGLTIQYSDVPNYYECMTTSKLDPIKLVITVTDTVPSGEHLLVTMNALSLPTDEEHLVSCAFDPNANNTQIITFVPHPNSWHYINITKLKGITSKYADCESYASRSEFEGIENHTVTSLMRYDKGRFFQYEYGLASPDEADATSLVTLSSETVTTVQFNINDFHDIGGNMIIEMGLLMVAKYYGGYKRILKDGAMYAFTEKDQFFKVVACLSRGHWSLPLQNDHCQYNDRVRPALFVLNSTDSQSIYDKITIPYPESGTWYLTMRLFCDEVVCPCLTSDDGSEYYVYSNVLDQKKNISGDTRLGVSKCNTTAVLSISSDKCISSDCMNEGECRLNSLTGLVLSYCYCSTGYGGWDCSDDSRLDSYAILLVTVLLLTLSNLLFIFTIYVAIIRRYYPEAFMFALTMVASTIYHACDVPVPVRFCLGYIETLQYTDFFCGIMSFWVVLLAMCAIPNSVRSSLYLSGALMISLLISWDMYSIMSFLLPVAIGTTVLLISWGIDYKIRRGFRYPKSFYTRHLPFGVILVTVGLVSFAFLQTEQNYKYVHSIWHMIIAVSAAFMLPDWKRESNAHPFLPSPKS